VTDSEKGNYPSWGQPRNQKENVY